MKKFKEVVKQTLGLRNFCQHASKQDINLIRNIGILAHIDAGKTTTTERMLFYAGKIRSMGEVHRGNTVTDFLEQEREREIPTIPTIQKMFTGITISSAAVSFFWKKYLFNLIDTPGHIDFTIEVERSLNVLDGAVVILDGCAGVEAQTLTVWRQADHYKLPRLVYVNKMDRPNSSVDRCLDTLHGKLNVHPLLLHIPIYDASLQLNGVVDLISMTHNCWQKGDGREFESSPLNPEEHGQVWETAFKRRNELVEKLADLDDAVAEEIIKSESLNIPPNVIVQSVRKITVDQKGIPVVCGSSYKNIGVQLLMNAIVHFLPCPVERNNQISYCFKDELCARAFKVVHDSQKKPVTFFRIYSGSLVKGQKIYNIQQEKTEQLARLMIPYADETIDVPTVSCGNIAAVGGLKETKTGDFVTSNASTASTAKKRLFKYQGESPQEGFGEAAKVPVPVFYCSIEAPSQAYQSQLESALEQLQREDPSLVVIQDEMTGQTVLGGMGELHLDIIKTRIISEYKINVELGSLQIAYQEVPQQLNIKETHALSHKIGNSQQKVTIVMTLLAQSAKDKSIVLLDRSPESAPNIANLHPRYLLAITQGVKRAFLHGPKLSCSVVDTCVMLHWCETSRGTTEHMVGAAATQCVQKMLKTVGTRLLEPLMSVEVVIDKDMSSAVLSDISRRRGLIQKITPREQQMVIEAQVPLAELLGYATDLRKLTSGNGSFTMELDSYQAMSSVEEAKAMKKVTGFDL
ncbi:Ribosome-releasing factor 2, mitochondrial [Gryllus bimaculatus]|nr:Ribosome-releasing factor 2, mitochondrial [Gryllus bimaculatus]